jgi:hypothetical protein
MQYEQEHEHVQLYMVMDKDKDTETDRDRDRDSERDKGQETGYMYKEPEFQLHQKSFRILYELRSVQWKVITD